MAALRATELRPIVEKTRPRVALVDHRFAEDVETVRDTAAPDLVVVTYGGEGDDDLTRRIDGRPTHFDAVDTAADDVALFGPTSGTTGVPKITTHFHRDVLAIDDTFGRDILRLEKTDVVACTAPLAFTFGLGMLVVFPLRAGACALLTEAATPVQLADLVAEHGVTALATAPTAYKQIVASGHVDRLSGLRVAVSAGEHMAQATWEGIRDAIGLKVIDGIGATEMLHIFISAAGDDVRPGATGRPVAGYRAAILDADGNEVGAGIEERLGVIGPVGAATSTTSASAATSLTGERHRRHLPARRRRLLLVPLAHRQHDRLVRLQHRRARGRGGARHAPRRRRGRRRRRARRPARLDRVRVRRAARGRRGRRRQGPRAPGPREGPDRPLQVPPRRALRRRVAAQPQRQAAALQAPADRRGPHRSGRAS